MSWAVGRGKPVLVEMSVYKSREAGKAKTDPADSEQEGGSSRQRGRVYNEIMKAGLGGNGPAGYRMLEHSGFAGSRRQGHKPGDGGRPWGTRGGRDRRKTTSKETISRGHRLKW